MVWVVSHALFPVSTQGLQGFAILVEGKGRSGLDIFARSVFSIPIPNIISDIKATISSVGYKAI